jgi:hypothetical protein
MLSTYKAILHGDRLEWRGEEPESVPMDRGIEVFVTILEEKVSSLTELSRGAAMAAALERLAQGGGLQEIEDPLLWERDVRGDRPLPGREP